MNLKELHERIGWQLEGRLQWKDFDGQWRDLKSEHSTPGISDDASGYQRRPDQPEMPDEVWLSGDAGSHEGAVTAYPDEEWARRWKGGTAVRYVRADRIFRDDEMQFRFRCDMPVGNEIPWEECYGGEYRFKP